MRPLVVDLCCGLGGWAEGFLADGWDVVGFDIDDAFMQRYPGEFHLADVRVLARCVAERHMSGWYGRLGTASLIVASPPCQEFSRHDQPWTKRRNPPEPDISIWRACEQIAETIGRPLIIENVRGAQKFVGRARAHVGPYYLWGDVPALMPAMHARKGFWWWGTQGSTSRTAGVRPKQSSTATAKAERSKVPFELAHYLATVFHNDLRRIA